MTQVVELLGTQGCHLCDVAERMVRRLALNCGVQIQYLDIANDPDLVERYGMRIPVLKWVIGSNDVPELNWPFSEEEFINWATQVA